MTTEGVRTDDTEAITKAHDPSCEFKGFGHLECQGQAAVFADRRLLAWVPDAVFGPGGGLPVEEEFHFDLRAADQTELGRWRSG